MSEPKTYAGSFKSPGGYMAIHGGHKVYLQSPRPEDFQPWRTAYGLAHEHRYGGNYGPYSVAQHAVLASETAARLGGTFQQQFAALHHDDTESVLGDMPHPVKLLCPDFRALEERLEGALEKRYGINLADPLIKEVDRIVFCAEIRWLVPQDHWHLYGEYGAVDYQRSEQPAGSDLVFWSPDEARKRYLEMHDYLERQL